jgi:hypothetical protein
MPNIPALDVVPNKQIQPRKFAGTNYKNHTYIGLYNVSSVTEGNIHVLHPNNITSFALSHIMIHHAFCY